MLCRRACRHGSALTLTLLHVDATAPPSFPRPPATATATGRKLRFKPAFNPYTEPSMEIFRCGKGWGTVG